MQILSPLLNSQQIAKASEYLASTRDRLVHILTGLSDSQWNFKPHSDAWSIAEVLEHLVLIEGRVHGIIQQMPNAPPAPERDDSQVEAVILANVPDRSEKFKAPPFICPSQQWSPQEALGHFLETRAATLELLVRAPALRGHVIPHPVLGPWDGYQWLLAAAAHCDRHINQIVECKAHPGFPAEPAAGSH